MGKNYNLGAWSGFKLVEILMVFLKEYLENITFEIKSADDKICALFPSNATS